MHMHMYINTLGESHASPPLLPIDRMGFASQQASSLQCTATSTDSSQGPMGVMRIFWAMAGEPCLKVAMLDRGPPCLLLVT